MDKYAGPKRTHLFPVRIVNSADYMLLRKIVRAFWEVSREQSITLTPVFMDDLANHIKSICSNHTSYDQIKLLITVIVGYTGGKMQRVSANRGHVDLSWSTALRKYNDMRDGLVQLFGPNREIETGRM